MSIILLITSNLLATPTSPSVSPEAAWLVSERPVTFLESVEPIEYQDEPLDHDAPRTESDNYLRLTGGLVTTEESSGPDEEIDFDEGYLVSAGFGHRFGASETGFGFGLELDGVWTDQDADDDGPIQAVSDVSMLGALLNGMLDFRLAERFMLYGGAGLGAAWLDVGTESDALNDFDEEDGPFLAWQAKAGLAWNFGASTSLHFGYRFLNIDDAEIDDDLGSASFDLETQQHVLEAGFLFGL